MTWLAVFYVLWMCVTQEGTNALILSYREDAAQMFIRRLKQAFRRLPEWIKADIKINNNTGFVEFTRTGEDEPFSRVEALPSTEDIGRGEAATLVILDEWAMHPYGAENFSAITDSLGTEGQVVGISTAKGAAGAFYNNWQGAIKRETTLVPVFISWDMHPDRDAGWYNRTLALKISALGPDLGKRNMYQEYPRTPDEAFVTSGSTVFDGIVLAQMREEARSHTPKRELPTEGLKEWYEPMIGKHYIMGVDCSEGLTDGDFMAATVRDWRTGMHVATLHGRWETRDFGRRLYALGERWNWAFMGVEKNGPGVAVLDALEDLAYPNLYYEVRQTGTSGQNVHVQLGWVTSKATKPIMIAEMVEAMAAGDMNTYDDELIGEYLTYVRADPRDQDVKVSNKAGRTGALRGSFDDMVMADLICWQMRKYFEKSDAVAAPYYSKTTATEEELEYMSTVRSGTRLGELKKRYGRILPPARYV